ncbi:hypothetical protein BJQ97_01049 [Geobacillus sp. TFV-3]|nr:hypothetical protein BJQ97_01049 [Geobacillus sp. TFV-3]
MNFDIVQAVLEIIFKRYMPYVTPVLFVFAVAMFGERLIGLLYSLIRR